MARVPYYERTLESFSDETITRARLSDDGARWYAALDVGPVQWASDPDFSTCAATRKAAIAECARKIRDCAKERPDAWGGLLSPGYDLHFRLAPYWETKERMAAGGRGWYVETRWRTVGPFITRARAREWRSYNNPIRHPSGALATREDRRSRYVAKRLVDLQK